ncbi:MAG: tRNA (adenosine(37)-N6)-threonylcarbamoyltransferase complex ATPase subunit type 1 TsaE [Firmicutes bacterium]|nr:tRNA (adenosine(37)-N6)-threonylcarbamoyltransferase complex ATPase subunit type 1 TsaE [Bacillota bacterium]
MTKASSTTLPWTFLSGSLEDTRQAGRQLARLWYAPSAVILQGELGAGKTHLIQSVLAAWGWKGLVKSPTFDLVHPYDLPNFTVYHVDLYRLGADTEDLDVLGLPNLTEENAVILAEWGTALANIYTEYFLCQIDMVATDRRRITVHAQGARMQARMRQWEKERL